MSISWKFVHNISLIRACSQFIGNSLPRNAHRNAHRISNFRPSISHPWSSPSRTISTTISVRGLEDFFPSSDDFVEEAERAGNFFLYNIG